MQTLQKKLIRIYHTENFPFLAFFVILLFFHGMFFMFMQDDGFYGTIPFFSILQYQLHEHAEISTRFVPEFFQLHLNHLPWLWRALDSFIYVLAAYCLRELSGLQAQRRNNILACFMVLCFPLTYMASAGWVATSANYIWSVTLGMLAFLPVKRIFAGEENHFTVLLLCFCGLCYAVFSEQELALLLGFLAAAIILLIRNKKSSAGYPVAAFAASVMVLVYKLLSPANANRIAMEMPQLFPDYATKNVIDKLFMGYEIFTDEFFAAPNLLFLLAAFMTAALIWQKHQDKLCRGIAVFPVLVLVYFAFLPVLLPSFYPPASERSIVIDELNYIHYADYLPFLIYSLALNCMEISVIILFSDHPEVSRGGAEAVFAALLLPAAVCTSLMMGFSASVYKSEKRVFLPAYMLMMLLLLMIYKKYPEEKTAQHLPGRRQLFYMIAGTAGVYIASALLSL